VRVLIWNLAGAGFHTGAPHSAAWEWLRTKAEFDIAMLQEAIPPSGLDSSFATALFRSRFPDQGLAWGNCILAREYDYKLVRPDHAAWAGSSMDAALIAEPVGDLPVLVNVHSNAKPIPDFPRNEFINAGGLACHSTKVWEIEVLAHQIRLVLDGRRFVLGGDLNAGLLLDEVYGYKHNENLWNNMAAQGYLDLRTRHSEIEQQTFFREKTNPYQLDHFFGDPTTEASVKRWAVLTEVAQDLKLSDHAPVVIDLA
jgi:hypothetical protein